MPNIAVVLREEITRLARKEVRSQTQKLQKATAQFRRDIATLKRHAAALKAQVTSMERRASSAAPAGAAEPVAAGARFSAKGLRSHRRLLGLSAADYGLLAGASGVSVYKWEQGSTHPRKPQVANLLSIRSLRKKEALTRLGQLRAKNTSRRKTKR